MRFGRQARGLALAGLVATWAFGCAKPDALVELGDLGARADLSFQAEAGTALRFRVHSGYFSCDNENALMLQRTLLKDGQVVFDEACFVRGYPNGTGTKASECPRMVIGGWRDPAACDLIVPERGVDTLRFSTHAKHGGGGLSVRKLKVGVYKR